MNAPILSPRPAKVPPKTEAEKRALGQFFTPTQVADFMATFFARELPDWRVIDAGAGAGALTLALVQRVVGQVPRPKSFHVTAYEIDETALGLLRETLKECAELCAEHGIAFGAEIREVDFIAHTTMALEQGLFAPALRTFNAAIANPPYRKLRAGSLAHAQLQAVGIDVTNLYSGFLALLSRLLEADAELVAIVPRSFCNGPYFRAFREDFLARMSFRRVHVFGSRQAAFAEESVLQENIILRAERSTHTPQAVEISSSRGDFKDSVSSRLHAWTDMVHPQDAQRFIHLPSDEAGGDVRAMLSTIPGRLTALGLSVSTGKVVDFRVKEQLRNNWITPDHPLLYPCHFQAGRLHWPKLDGKKPNGLAVTSDRMDLLVPMGVYVVVRRFSSKEERKRIVASLVEPERLPPEASRLAIENHLNFFHRDGHGLPVDVAWGLTAYLNWSVVDAYFRQFNGHTQVNATDLRSLPYPAAEVLAGLGQALTGSFPSQEQLDAVVASHCLNE